MNIDWNHLLPEWLLADALSGEEYILHCWAPRFLARGLTPYGSAWKAEDLLWIDPAPAAEEASRLQLAGGDAWAEFYRQGAALHELPATEQLRRLARQRPLVES